ncbi:MAG: dockerin type I domain-containing protein, partial [Eubacteriales bacterium]|nr:dockerin type I domain-containing protein [Eubacteriales bacterium]
IRENTFIDISEVDIKNYNGLQECLEVLEIGLPIGDVDYDGELTIVDATEIQRVMANLSAFKESDIIKADILSEDKLVFISDFNRDGERTILDATAIQMKLAKVE